MDNANQGKEILVLTALEAQDPKVLGELMTQPFTLLAEGITGAMALGKKEALMIGGRLVQGILKGNFFQQLGREVKKLVEAGRIPEDYANKKYGFQSLADVMKLIDNETIDQDKFDAVKAMFATLNATDCPPNEETLRYQLFKITIELSSSQLILLRAIYEMTDRHFSGTSEIFVGGWLHNVASKLGHNIDALVELDEQPLIDHKLITERRASNVKIDHNRLTSLGLKLCEFLCENS
jgi:hypothetical protein